MAEHRVQTILYFDLHTQTHSPLVHIRVYGVWTTKMRKIMQMIIGLDVEQLHAGHSEWPLPHNKIADQIDQSTVCEVCEAEWALSTCVRLCIYSVFAERIYEIEIWYLPDGRRRRHRCPNIIIHWTLYTVATALLLRQSNSLRYTKWKGKRHTRLICFLDTISTRRMHRLHAMPLIDLFKSIR